MNEHSPCEKCKPILEKLKAPKEAYNPDECWMWQLFQKGKWRG